MKSDQIEVDVKDPQVYVSKKLRDELDKLKSRPEFEGLDQKDLFFFALILGYSNSSRLQIPAGDFTQSGYFREKNFTDEERAVFYSIAVEAEDTIDVLGDIRKVIAIAEEYANGGCKYIKEFVYDGSGSLDSKLAEMLLPYIEKGKQ